jgi:glucose/arabinose dehydrogenase
MTSQARVGALLIALAISAIAVCSFLRAQTVAQPKVAVVPAPAYEVVAIKPAKQGAQNGGWRSLPDGFEARDMPLRGLVYSAYGIIMESQVSGMPAWAESDPYDIDAKVDAETAEAWKNLPFKERVKQEQPMLR